MKTSIKSYVIFFFLNFAQNASSCVPLENKNRFVYAGGDIVHCICWWRHCILYMLVETLYIVYVGGDIVYAGGDIVYCICWWGHCILYMLVETLYIVYAGGGIVYCGGGIDKN